MLKQQILLKILADGKYHSGSKLGEELGVSRAAIWKTIQKIESDYSLEVFAVKGKGYRLQNPLQLLNEKKINQHLSASTQKQIRQFEIFSDISSTNQYLNTKSLDGAPSGHLVLAEQQTKGVGRRGKCWISPFGNNLYLSLLWRFQYGPAQLGCLSLFVAVAVVRALKKMGITDAGVKWPNDIYWENQKLAGILLEMRGEFSGPSAIVLGIGVNINDAVSCREMSKIDQPWINVERILKQKVDRNLFTAFVIDALFDVLNSIPDEQNELLEEWRQLDILKGQHIDVTFADKMLSGTALGVNSDGVLRMSHKGKEVLCHSGEVSIRRG